MWVKFRARIQGIICRRILFFGRELILLQLAGRKGVTLWLIKGNLFRVLLLKGLGLESIRLEW